MAGSRWTARAIQGSLRFALHRPYVGNSRVFDVPYHTLIEYGDYEALVSFGLEDGAVARGDGPIAYMFSADRIGDVPEPANWALMAAGFGVAGGLMRRARREPAMA